MKYSNVLQVTLLVFKRPSNVTSTIIDIIGDGPIRARGMGRIRHIDGELHCVAKHRDAARFLSNFYVNTVYRGPFFEYTVWTGIEVGTFGPFCCPPRPSEI